MLFRSVKCFGAHTGEIEVEMTSGVPPFTYQWSNGMSGSNIQGVQAGVYAVTITDSFGCTTKDSIAIVEGPPFVFTLDSLQNEVCSYSNGAIYTHANGGVGSYHFDWSHNDTLDLPFAESLHAGIYSVFVYDSLNCAKSLEVIVGGQPHPIADFYALPYRAFLDRATINFVKTVKISHLHFGSLVIILPLWILIQVISIYHLDIFLLCWLFKVKIRVLILWLRMLI